MLYTSFGDILCYGCACKMICFKVLYPLCVHCITVQFNDESTNLTFRQHVHGIMKDQWSIGGPLLFKSCFVFFCLFRFNLH